MAHSHACLQTDFEAIDKKTGLIARYIHNTDFNLAPPCREAYTPSNDISYGKYVWHQSNVIHHIPSLRVYGNDSQGGLIGDSGQWTG